MHDHTTIMDAKFFEKYIICTYGMQKIILIDNGGEWYINTNNLCNNQYITP